MINKFTASLAACLAIACSTACAAATVTEPKDNVLENVKLTHYCICEKCCGKTPDHPAYGITASGREAEPYVSVAVDPKLIPLGSTVWIEYADGKVIECRADDTGGAINGSRIDLCVSSHKEAWNLGVEYVTVTWEVENKVHYSDDPVADYLRHDADKQKELERLPKCENCGEHIQDEYCYEINDEIICQKCLESIYRKDVRDWFE